MPFLAPGRQIRRVVDAVACILLTAGAAAAQVTDATFPASVGLMYPVSTSDAWAALLKVTDQYDLKADSRVDDNGLLITRALPVERRKFGVHAGDISPTLRSGRVRLHVFVPPFIEPARVYVGSTMVAELARIENGTRASMLVYNVDQIGTWLLGRIAAQLKTEGRLIPQDPGRRASLAKSLLPGGNHRCLTLIEKNSQPSSPAMPLPLHREQPVFPKARLDGTSRTVTVRSVVGEDGFAWPIGVTGGPTVDDYATTAMGAAALWRFFPRTIDGCPAVTPLITTQLSFRTR